MFVLAVSAATFATMATMHAQEYRLHFSDPIGDHVSGFFDIIGMDFTFDPRTGDYDGRFYASETAPFSRSSGAFWFNLALANRQRQGPGYPGGRMHTVAPGTLLSDTVLVFRGVDPELIRWLPGDVVAPTLSDIPVASGVLPYLPTLLTSPYEFVGVGLVVMDSMRIDQAAVIIPEPAMLWLGVLALGAFVVRRRFYALQ